MDSIAQISFTARTADKKKSETNLKLAESTAVDNDLIFSNENVHSEKIRTTKTKADRNNHLDEGMLPSKIIGTIQCSTILIPAKNEEKKVAVENTDKQKLTAVSLKGNIIKILPKDEIKIENIPIDGNHNNNITETLAALESVKTNSGQEVFKNDADQRETKYTEKFLTENLFSYGIPSVNPAGRLLPKDLFDQVSNKSEKITSVVDLTKTANEYKSASQLNTEISHIGKIKTEEPSDEEIENELPPSKDYFDHVYIIGEHNPLSEETKRKLDYIFIECDLSSLDVSNFNTLFESMEPIKSKSVCILLFNFSVITKTEASLKALIPKGFKNDTAIHVLNWSPNDSLYTGQDYIHSRVKLLIEIIKIISKKIKVVVLPLEPTRINVLLTSDLTKSHQPSEDGYFVWGSNDKWAKFRASLVQNWKMLLKINGKIAKRTCFQYGSQHIFPISIHELNGENMEEIKKNWRQNANDIVLKLCGKKIQDSEMSEEPKIYSSDDICTQNSDSSLEPVNCCVSIRKRSNSIPDEFFDDLVNILEPEATVLHVEGRAQILFTSHKGNLLSKILNGHHIGDTVLGATLLCSGCYVPTNRELNLMQIALQKVALHWNRIIMKNVRKNLLQGLNFTCYKTVKCEKENCNILSCIFYHSDVDRRRNPLNLPYLDEPCLHNPCLWLDRCSRTHNSFEKMLHPRNMYKEPCPQFLSREECFRTNPLCLSAHKDSPELFFSPHWKDMLVSGTIYTFQYLAGAIRRFNVADPLFQNCRIFVIGATRKFLNNLKNSVENICSMHRLSCSSVGKVDGMHHVLLGTPSAFNTKCKLYNLLSFNVIIISQLKQIMSDMWAKNNLIQFLNRFKLHSQPPYIQKLFVADSYDIIHKLGFDKIFKSDLEHLLGETIHMPSGDPESIVQFKYDVPLCPMKKPDWLPNNSPPPIYRLYLNTEEISQKRSIETPTKKNEVSSSFVRITEDRLQPGSQNDFISQPYQSSSMITSFVNSLKGDVDSFLVDLDGRSNSGFTKRQHQSSVNLSKRSAKKQDTSSGNNNRSRQSRSKSPRSRRKKSTLKNKRSRSRSPRSFSSRHRRSRRNRSRSKSPRPRRSRSRSMISKRKRSRSEFKRSRSRSLRSKRKRSRSKSPRSRRSRSSLHMLKISSKCYSKDSFLKRLGKKLFKEFEIDERLVCLKLDEEFEMYRKVPDMYNKYEECYGSFNEKYTLKFPDEDEEHKDRFWRAFWESEFKYVKKFELEHRIRMLMTDYMNKSSRALPSVSLPSVPIAPSPSKSLPSSVIAPSVAPASLLVPIPASYLPVPGFTTITPSSLSVPVPVPSITPVTAPVPVPYITPSSLTTSIPVPFITPSPVPSLTPFLPAPGPVPFPFPSIVAPLVPASSSRTRSPNTFSTINLRSLIQKLKEEENMKDSEGIENDIEKTLATLEIVVPDMGIFGHSVASILGKVKDLGKTTKEALKLFTESDNIALIEMAFKFTKSKCCTSKGKVIFLDILEKDIRKLFEYAQQVQKEENHINVEANSAIIDMIRNVALYQGLELDNKEITQMFLQICSHLKNQ